MTHPLLELRLHVLKHVNKLIKLMTSLFENVYIKIADGFNNGGPMGVEWGYGLYYFLEPSDITF